MKTIDDKISAWIDNGLDEAEAARMAALAAEDPAVAARAERLRHLDDLVRSAVPEEPVPDELIERLGLAGTPVSNVIDFASASSRRNVQHAATLRQKRRGAFFWDSRRAAGIVALVGLGLGVFALTYSPAPNARNDAQYRALGDAPQAGAQANALVLFEPDVSPAEARAIANAAGARIVGQATSAGAWKLSVEDARLDAALGSLRARKDVLLAEPIGGDAP